MVSILKHQSILSIFPRLTNKFCNHWTNDASQLNSFLFTPYTYNITKTKFTYNL